MKSDAALPRGSSTFASPRTRRSASLRGAVRAVFIIAVVGALLGTAGCASWGRRAKERKVAEAAPAIPLPRMMGTITLVNEESRFVLIDGGTLPTLAEGTALKSFTGEVESGVLSVGPMRRRPFVIADIVKGAPQKGDRVFQ